jgi:hypothetical protein
MECDGMEHTTAFDGRGGRGEAVTDGDRHLAGDRPRLGPSARRRTAPPARGPGRRRRPLGRGGRARLRAAWLAGLSVPRDEGRLYGELPEKKVGFEEAFPGWRSKRRDGPLTAGSRSKGQSWSPGSALNIREPPPPSALRPAGPPWLFFLRLRPGSWRPLLYPGATSLSTGIGTGNRGNAKSKPHDDARAKCGARKCRRDQHHDPPPHREKTTILKCFELCRSR